MTAARLPLASFVAGALGGGLLMGTIFARKGLQRKFRLIDKEDRRGAAETTHIYKRVRAGAWSDCASGI